MEIIIKLNDIEKVKKFVNNMNTLECSVDIRSKDAHYIVDAKSILGVFSLDLSNPVIVTLNSSDPATIGAFKNFLSELE